MQNFQKSVLTLDFIPCIITIIIYDEAQRMEVVKDDTNFKESRWVVRIGSGEPLNSSGNASVKIVAVIGILPLSRIMMMIM